MNYFWYVYDGAVEEYNGQEVDEKSSAIVFARSPEDAILKFWEFHQGMTELITITFEGKIIEVIS